MTQVPTVTFNDGVQIPQLGFGVWQVPPTEVYAAVSAALETGYRSIDTAAMYRNEEGVGQAIASAGIPREEVFVTTKLNNPDHGYDAALRAFDQSRQRLGLEFIDLYLIHWPLPKRDAYVETWKAFEKLRADGKVRSIGVSNFHVTHLERLRAEADVTPVLDQIELHPHLVQDGLRRYHAEHQIRTEAWSPLASGGAVLHDATVEELAKTYGKTPAQVILRWHLQLGNVVIPKSVTPARIRENFDVFDFELTNDDVARVTALDRGARTGPNPDTLDA